MSSAGRDSGVRLLGAGDIRGIAGRLDVRPTKKLGQNFVVEQGTVRQITALAGVRPGDLILEVGPGLGSLTLALLEARAAASPWIWLTAGALAGLLVLTRGTLLPFALGAVAWIAVSWTT